MGASVGPPGYCCREDIFILFLTLGITFYFTTVLTYHHLYCTNVIDLSTLIANTACCAYILTTATALHQFVNNYFIRSFTYWKSSTPMAFLTTGLFTGAYT